MKDLNHSIGSVCFLILSLAFGEGKGFVFGGQPLGTPIPPTHPLPSPKAQILRLQVFCFGGGVGVLPYPGVHSPRTPNYEQVPAPSPHSFLNKKVYG